MGWVGPIAVPRRWSSYAWRTASIASPWIDRRIWWIAAAAVGILPVLAGYALGTSAHQPATALLLFVLLLAAVRDDKPARGMGALALAFAAHSATAITLTALDPSGAGAVFPGGEAYWNAQRTWIATGVDPEHDLSTWLPAHAQQLAGVVVFGFVSFGFVALLQGFHEVDLMNSYVGRLVAGSDDPVGAVLLGWHPWSILRGLAYVVFVYELASWSLARFTGRDLGSVAVRRFRWILGLTLLAADALVKIGFTEPVRAALTHHLP